MSDPLALLEVDNLQVHYRTDRGTARAVDGASFVVPERGIMGLVGESGCGKTTAVRAIMRVMPVENDDRRRYRIKSTAETFERVANEDQLTRSR